MTELQKIQSNQIVFKQAKCIISTVSEHSSGSHYYRVVTLLKCTLHNTCLVVSPVVSIEHFTWSVFPEQTKVIWYDSILKAAVILHYFWSRQLYSCKYIFTSPFINRMTHEARLYNRLEQWCIIHFIKTYDIMTFCYTTSCLHICFAHEST